MRWFSAASRGDVPGGAAISPKNGRTVHNLGQIQAEGSGSDGIRLNNDSEAINEGTITASGDSLQIDDVILVSDGIQAGDENLVTGVIIFAQRPTRWNAILFMTEEVLDA